MLRISLDFDNTTADIEAAQKVLAVLHKKAEKPDAVADELSIEDWFERLGDGSRLFWYLAAYQSLSKESWTFHDLAEISGDEVEKLRSYQRNSYRAIKATRSPNPLISRWDTEHQHNVYSMHDCVRDRILELCRLKNVAVPRKNS